MKLHQQSTPNVNTIRAIEPGRIKINDQFYNNSLLVTSEKIDNTWIVKKPEELTVEILEELLKHKPEIIIIGSGLQHHFLDPMLTLTATQQGIGIEIMTTEAACHTYNILIGEDRDVLAALII
ncbi:MAG: Mth938-like domain-containing protein [Gammaproteobacteria bacterium]|nr:MAG: Mth938-like domain-containing protein [Gammaproteobacteria bacterium]